MILSRLLEQFRLSFKNGILWDCLQSTEFVGLVLEDRNATQDWQVSEQSMRNGLDGQAVTDPDRQLGSRRFPADDYRTLLSPASIEDNLKQSTEYHNSL